MKLRSHSVLPDGYAEIYSLDIKNDKKLSLLINIFAIIIALVIVIPAHFYIPIWSMFSMDEGIGMYVLRFVVLMVSSVFYIILHEAVHGIAMKMCGTKKISYGFTGLYAFAGSKDYYDKHSYIFIALAPVVVWGVVIGIINLFVPYEWFWIIYWIQISNISGAAGDMYVTYKFSRMPKDILITDYGLGMKVYSQDSDKGTN